MRFIDLTGKKFGRLLVVKRTDNSIDGHTMFLCKCECGNIKSIRSQLLRKGVTKSCGCLSIETTKLVLTKHGYAHYDKQRKSEYNIWKTMRQRCFNPNNHKYKDYGGRGITVCERWGDFKKFISDMGERPSKYHSIDRIDVNGNYEPSNCRWALPAEQSRNIRLNPKNISGKHGVVWNKDNKKWRVSIRVNNKNKHIGYYENVEDAINARLEAEKYYWQ